MSKADVAAAELRLRRSTAKLSGEGERVRYLGSLLFPGDEVVFFHFDAASECAARRASERARLPFERIVEAVGEPAGGNRNEKGVE